MLICIYNEKEEWIEVITNTKKVFYIDCSANGLEKELLYEQLPVLKHCSLVKYDRYYSECPKGAYSVNIKDGLYVIAEECDVMTRFEQLYFGTKKEHAYSTVFELSKMLIENIGAFVKADTKINDEDLPF